MTINYEFPHDITLAEVRSIVAENDNFILAERDGHYVANYLRAGNDTHPPVIDRKTAIMRELRGLIFCAETEKVISRRYQKFFNIGERQDLMNIDITQEHVILEKLDGCLVAESMINFCDGSTHKISEIVSKKLTGPIWGMDVNNNIIQTNIINWSKLDKTDNWLKITINDENKSRIINITPNHKIMTNNGWKRSDELTIGESIFRKEKQFTSIQKSMIYGSLLGDMSLIKNGGAYVLQYSVKSSHISYNKLKAKILQPYHTNFYNTTGGYGTPQIKCTTRCSGALKEIQKNTYKGKKKLNINWLMQLNEISLAFWYMDDGSISRGSEKQKPRAVLHTESFPKDEIDIILEYFDKKWNLFPVVSEYRGYYCLRFNNNEAIKFWNLINPYMHREMRYKMPDNYHNEYCFWDKYENDTNEIYRIDNKSWKIVNIQHENKKRFRYDIQTGTENFFVNNILVHNSMIAPYLIGNRMIWGSKMGDTFLAPMIDEFIADKPKYNNFAHLCFIEGKTPIFEWVSRKQKIVLDYPEDNLILVAIRDNSTGAYVPYHALIVNAMRHGLPYVQKYDGLYHKGGLNDIVDAIRELEDAEGVVILFGNGHMVKQKSDWYIGLHRAKSLLENERDVLGIILDEKDDDLLPLLIEQDRQNLVRYSEQVWHDIHHFKNEIEYILTINKNMTRKEFALHMEQMNYNRSIRSIAFIHFEDKFVKIDTIIKYIRNKLGSNKAFQDHVLNIVKTRWKEVKIND